MEQIVLDFYNKKVNNILDMLVNTKSESGWNKDFLTYGQIATYVDTLGLSEGRRTEVYITLKDFFFNHLYEFQKIILGLPDNVLDEEENKQKALRYLHKLYGDKIMTKEDLMYKVGDFVHYSYISMDPDFDDRYGYGTIIEIKDLPKSFEKETKYSKGWLDSHGRQWIYEDMETGHLLNVYHHIKNNLQAYLNFGLLRYEDIEIRKTDIDNTRNEMKQELLLRGLSDPEIENHIEETWKMSPNPYKVEV